MPAKTQALATRKRRSPARKDALFRQLHSGAGPSLPTALSYSGDLRARQLLALMLDPAYSRHSLAKLCQRVGLTQLDLLDLMRRYWHAAAMVPVLEQLPDLMRDLLEDARSRTHPCPECAGKGKVRGKRGPEWRACPRCYGLGSVRVVGDHQARKVLLRAAGFKT